MAQYEVTLTAVIEAPNDAQAAAAQAKVEKLAPSVTPLLAMQGIKLVGKLVVGTPKKRA